MTASPKLANRSLLPMVFAIVVFCYGISKDSFADPLASDSQKNEPAAAKTVLAEKTAAESYEPASLSYNRDVRPILSKNCFLCHGPDEEDRQAGVRLDVADEADLSEVLARIVSADPDLVMPPPETNKTLSPSEIKTLQRWVDSGAAYEQHWAFVLPQKREVPDGIHPVDYFINRRLKQRGLKASAQADPYTRIRRVYLDLTGLPPSLNAADAFAADPSPQAYAAVVDRLLVSPAYGERWARRWLDLARYADTNGYEKDRDRTIWPYRDWVIRALNSGMPFDQFTIEQIAGDMLPNPTDDQMIATGFHRNTMLNEEGGIDPLEFRYHAMTDRVATTGTTWLGLTTGCAQCHTHKYDPITHHDYFGMMAYLNNADEPDYHVSPKQVTPQEAEAKQQENHAEAERLLAELDDKWPKTKPVDSKKPEGPQEPEVTIDEAYRAWFKQEKNNHVEWQTLLPRRASANIPYLVVEEDGVLFASGDTSKHDIFTLEYPASKRPVASIRLQVLTDQRLPGGGPGTTYYEGPKGDFFLSELRIELADGRVAKYTGASETAWSNAFSSNQARAKHAIDGDIQTGWSIGKKAGTTQTAVFNLKEPIPAGVAFSVRMDFSRHYASSLGKFRLSATEAMRPVKASNTVDEVLARLAEQKAEDGLNADPAVREAFLMQAPQLASQAKKIRQLRQPVRGTPTLVMRERPAENPRPTFLHNRGEYTQPQEQVEPRLPDALLVNDRKLPSNRLEFARWLVTRDNPLTARVVVNRHWATLFGTGIVKTVDDFGMQGELPTHPQLLDWLAVDFMDNGWSLKRLHRLIVTSDAYQRNSETVAKNNDSESYRLLQRYTRTRLEAEIIRDTALAASGLLSDKRFGPPVRPPQPASAQAANYKKSTWRASKGEDRFRRSVYTYQKRTAPFAMFTTFDAPTGEACVARRDVSNTALHALTLLNDPMFMEIAVASGKRMAAVEGNDLQRIESGFRWLMTRPPAEDELAMLADFYAKHQDWTALARVLLSLDEAITKN